MRHSKTAISTSPQIVNIQELQHHKSTHWNFKTTATFFLKSYGNLSNKLKPLERHRLYLLYQNKHKIKKFSLQHDSWGWDADLFSLGHQRPKHKHYHIYLVRLASQNTLWIIVEQLHWPTQTIYRLCDSSSNILALSNGWRCRWLRSV